jgi:hypothetical protein
MRKASTVELGCLWETLARVGASLVCAGLSYGGWLAAFLLTSRLKSPIVQAIGWVLAPVATAAGFAAGIAISERLTSPRKSGFVRIFLWPLAGCVLGAGAVYWFGPMLIVFGMFAVGTASTILREVILHTREAGSYRRSPPGTAGR